MTPADYAREYATARCAARQAYSQYQHAQAEQHITEAGRVRIRARRQGGREASLAVKRMGVVLNGDQSIADVDHAMFVAGFGRS